MRKKIELIEHDFEGDLFIDVGGNIGMWSAELYDLYNKIYFIEPSADAILKAKNNLVDKKHKISYFKNICSNILGEKKSIFSCSSDTGNFSVFGKELYKDNIALEENMIETITLDSLLPTIKQENNILIKVDTEGSDLDILLGSLELIKEKTPTIIMEAHYHMHFDQDKHDRVFDTIRSLGYSVQNFKNQNYLAQANHIFDGVHNGTQMYDKHFQILMTP